MKWFTRLPSLPSLQNTLLHKWIALNAFCFALAAAAYSQGWVTYIFEKDVSNVSYMLAIGGVIGLAISFFKAVALNKREKNVEAESKGFHKKVYTALSPSICSSEMRESLKNNLMSNISIVPMIGNILLFLGVLGTVAGLIIGFYGITPASVSTVSGMVPVVAGLLKGLSIAFHTTLVGGIFSLWLQLNNFLLTQSSSGIYQKILDR